MSSSEEHLQRLTRLQRPDGDGPRRRLAVLITALALVVALAGAGIVWRALGRPATAGGSAAVLVERARAWWLDQQADLLLPPSDDDAVVEFEVGPGESLPALAQRLETVGLVRSADAFRLLARVRGLDRQVQAGAHALRRNMTAEEVLEALLVGHAEGVMVTLREGWRAEEIGAALEAAGVAESAAFLALVAEGRADQSALADRPVGAGLEGFLFPDTYEFEPEVAPEVVVARLLDTFEARLTSDLRALAQADNLRLFDVVTLASIVERETAVAEERGQVARVYLNRLANAPFILNADPTVQYALGYQADAATWWKRGLTSDDLAIDSPYNTYRRPGLPPGPIANPGLASIRAVLEPAAGGWQYFVANDLACDGSHVFAMTWEEHLANVATYRTGGCGQP